MSKFRTYWRTFFDGLILANQFLTVIPLKKQVSWDKERAKMSVRAFPLVGLLLGGLITLQAFLLIEFSPFSMLAITFWLFFFSVLFTGGLHIDGWMDCSDAYFSYRDQERRLDIMKDSRVGAFGVLSVLFLLGWRFLFMYEVLQFKHELMYVALLIFPLFSRVSMGLILVNGQLARNEGMAFAFREHVTKEDVIYYYSFYLFLFLSGLIAFFGSTIALYLAIFVVSIISFYVIYLRFITREFAGVTGDTLGASVEGGEAWLWLILWLLLYFVMG